MSPVLPVLVSPVAGEPRDRGIDVIDVDHVLDLCSGMHLEASFS